jgi:hypothetical protein
VVVGAAVVADLLEVPVLRVVGAAVVSEVDVPTVASCADGASAASSAVVQAASSMPTRTSTEVRLLMANRLVDAMMRRHSVGNKVDCVMARSRPILAGNPVPCPS